MLTSLPSMILRFGSSLSSSSPNTLFEPSMLVILTTIDRDRASVLVISPLGVVLLSLLSNRLGLEVIPFIAISRFASPLLCEASSILLSVMPIFLTICHGDWLSNLTPFTKFHFTSWPSNAFPSSARNALTAFSGLAKSRKAMSDSSPVSAGRVRRISSGGVDRRRARMSASVAAAGTLWSEMTGPGREVGLTFFGVGMAWFNGVRGTCVGRMSSISGKSC